MNRVLFPILTHTTSDLRQQLFNSIDQVDMFADRNIEREIMRIKYDTSACNSFTHIHRKGNSMPKFSLKKPKLNLTNMSNQWKANVLGDIHKSNDNTTMHKEQIVYCDKSTIPLDKSLLQKTLVSNPSMSVMTRNKDSRRSTMRIEGYKDSKENMILYKTIFNNTNTVKYQRPKVLSFDNKQKNTISIDNCNCPQSTKNHKKKNSKDADFVLSTQYELRGIQKKISFLGNVLNYVYPLILKSKIEPLLTDKFKSTYKSPPTNKESSKDRLLSQISSQNQLQTQGPILPMQHKKTHNHHPHHTTSTSFNLSRQKHSSTIKSPQSKFFSIDKAYTKTKNTYHTNELTLEL